MTSTLTTVLPIFALVLAGWLARRTAVLGPHAVGEINRFVVYLALPALLFGIVARARFGDIWHPGFIAAFGAGSLAVFGLTVAIRRGPGRDLADAVLDGLNAGYANTGFMGFPLAAVALGPAALAPTLVATILTVCVLFAVAIVLIEIGLQSEARRGRLALKVARSLVRNPLLVAPLAAALVPLTGSTLWPSADTFLKLLGGAASPCALVALGLFLAESRTADRPDTRSTALLVAFKLLLQPLVTWVLAAWVFRLAAPLTETAVLLAALPTGTGPFMLAEFYRRELAVTARAILVSTVLSVVTLSAYLAWIH